MHLNKFGVLTCSDFQRFGCNAVENKLVEVRLIRFCSEGGQFHGESWSCSRLLPMS